MGHEIRGVLLDIDGTLVLSNDAHASAWVQAFAAHGYEVPFPRVRSLIGMGGDKVLPTLIPGLSDEEGPGKEIAVTRQKIFKEQYASMLVPAPGSRSLVSYLQGEGLHVVVASSAKPEELTVLLQRADVEDLLKERTTSGDAAQSKPAPDIVAVALKRMELPAEQVVMVGDTPYDIEAAGKIGVATIAVRCGGFSDEELSGAAAIYDHPADIQAHFASFAESHKLMSTLSK